MLTCLIHQVAAEPAAATAVPGQETIAEEPEAEAAAATEVTYVSLFRRKLVFTKLSNLGLRFACPLRNHIPHPASVLESMPVDVSLKTQMYSLVYLKRIP